MVRQRIAILIGNLNESPQEVLFIDTNGLISKWFLPTSAIQRQMCQSRVLKTGCDMEVTAERVSSNVIINANSRSNEPMQIIWICYVSRNAH